MTTLQILQLIPIAYFLVISVPLIITNLREHRLKNIYVLPALPLWLVCATTYAVLSGEWLNSLVIPFLLFIASFVFFIYLGAKDVVGMGDVKLTTILALTISFNSAWVWLSLPLIAFVIGAICFIYVARKKKLEVLPMGPILMIVYFAHLVFFFAN